MRILWELIWRGYRGRVRRMAKLARQPKYFLGTAVGLLYFGGMVLRPILAGDNPGRAFAAQMTGELMRGFHLLAALGAGLYVSLSWAFMPARPGLRLREPELHLFLPAPVPRSTLIQFAILRGIPGMLIGAFFLGWFFGAGSFAARMTHALGIFVLFLMWDLHGKGRNLWKMRLKELPAAAALPRRAVMYAVIGLFWIVTAFGFLRLFAAARAAIATSGGVSMEAWRVALEAASTEANHGFFSALVTPLRWVTAPLFAPPGTPMLAAWIFIAALVAAHYVWVIRAQARFEEAVLHEEQKLAASGDKRTRRRLGLSPKRRASAPFALGRTGRPEIALFWKDLLVITRTPLRLLALVWLGIVAVATAAITFLGPESVVFQIALTLTLMACVAFPFMTGLLWQNGFRRDLRYLEILRTFPVSYHRLVLGQLLAPMAQSTALVLTGFGLLLGMDWGLKILGDPTSPMPTGIVPPSVLENLHVDAWSAPFAGMLTLLPFILGVIAVSSALECIGVLLLPGWFLALDVRRGDPSSIGQRIIVGFGFFVVMIFGILPGAIVATVVLVGQHAFGIPVVAWELPVLSLLVAAPLFLEAWGLIRLGGKLWKGLDPSQEILEGFR